MIQYQYVVETPLAKAIIDLMRPGHWYSQTQVRRHIVKLGYSGASAGPVLYALKRMNRITHRNRRYRIGASSRLVDTTGQLLTQWFCGNCDQQHNTPGIVAENKTIECWRCKSRNRLLTISNIPDCNRP